MDKWFVHVYSAKHSPWQRLPSCKLVDAENISAIARITRSGIAFIKFIHLRFPTKIHAVVASA